MTLKMGFPQVVNKSSTTTEKKKALFLEAPLPSLRQKCDYYNKLKGKCNSKLLGGGKKSFSFGLRHNI